VPGNQNHWQVTVDGPGFLQQRQPIHPRHSDVTDHHAGPAQREYRKYLLCVAETLNVETSQFKGLPVSDANVLLIVYEQDLLFVTHRNNKHPFQRITDNSSLQQLAMVCNRPN